MRFVQVAVTIVRGFRQFVDGFALTCEAGVRIKPVVVLLLAGVLAMPISALAQETGSGFSFITKFSGTTIQIGADGTEHTVLDADGQTGVAVDLSAPGRMPTGHHWSERPQLFAVTASQIGQVFGIAMDDASPPNIYLTATAAFGLHRNVANTGWAENMWGQNGGPGTIYRLSAEDGYKPSVFAQITLDGRQNTGPALGNIAYDRWNGQLYVSDLESGMIHRLRISDGLDLGRFDHGATARASFLDAASGEVKSLEPVPFNPATVARTSDCTSGDFSRDPSCWNFADFRRRIWGLGVRRESLTGVVRLYYSVWGSQGFGNPVHATAGEDARNSLWSVAIDSTGEFDAISVQREFVLPDFFRSPADVARAGFSHPISDIAFPTFGEQDVMLLAERGGVRNLGLEAENAFAYPHESRVLRYRIDDAKWIPAGRYDVSYQDRRAQGPPYLRAGSAGGVSFSSGFKDDWTIDQARPDAFVWMSGDALCSPTAACRSVDGDYDDHSQVHGIQGRAIEPIEVVEPASAFQPYPLPGPAYPPTGPDASYMVDADGDLVQNDATRIGDVEVYQAVPDPTQRLADGGPWLGPWEGDWPWPLPNPADEDYTGPIDPGGDIPELVITKAGPLVCDWDRECAFLITVANNGPGVYSGPLHVVDTSQGGVNPGGSAGWICEQPVAPGPVACRHEPVVLDAGDSVFLALTLDMPVPPGGPPPWTVERWNCGFIVWPAVLTGTDNIRAVEAALLLNGYDPGLVDGIEDVNTQAAIDAYRDVHALPPGGIDEVLFASLFPDSSAMAGDANPDNDWACAPYVMPGEDGFIPPPPLETFDLAVEKTLISERCQRGEVCDFLVTVSNVGGEDVSARAGFRDSAEVDGDALENAAYGPSFADPDCGLAAGTGIECVRPAEVFIPHSGAATIEWRVSLRIPDEPDAENLHNCAILDWAAMGLPGHDGNGFNDWMCMDVAIAPDEEEGPAADPDVRPQLLIEKNLVSDSCSAGEQCDFEVTLTNVGDSMFEGRITFNDLAELTTSGRLESDAISSSEVMTCEPSGDRTRCMAVHDVRLTPDDPTIAYKLWVDVPEDADGQMMRNCASINWDAMGFEVAEGEAVWLACAEVTIGGEAERIDLELVVDTESESAICRPGEDCVYSITVKNLGDDPFEDRWAFRTWSRNPANGVQLGVSSEFNLAFDCEATSEEGSVRCFYGSDGPAGAPLGASGIRAFPHISLPEELDWSELEIVAEIDWAAMSASGDTNSDNDQSSVILEIEQEGADMGADSDTSCNRGQSCTMEARMVNSGKKPFVGALGIRGSLVPPVVITAIASKTEGLACRVTGFGTYECLSSRISVEPGKDNAARIDVTIAVPADFRPEEITHAKDLVWPDAQVKDRNTKNDHHESTIEILDPQAPVVLEADLAIGKIANQGSCIAGQACQFSITVTNNGPATINGRINLKDAASLDGGSARWARLADHSPTSWQCRSGRGDFACFRDDVTLASGQSVSLSASILTSRNHPGTMENCARLPGAGDAPDIRAVQEALNARGYGAGTTDGIMGRRTRAALRAFQRDEDLQVTGEISVSVIERLLGISEFSDNNTTNNTACVSVDVVVPRDEEPSAPEVEPQPAPPVIEPDPEAEPEQQAGPVCRRGWQLVATTRKANALAEQGWQIEQRRKGGKRILCAKPPQIAPLACTTGWQQVTSRKAGKLKVEGWQIEQKKRGNESILCAKPPQATPPQCKRGWKQVTSQQAGNLKAKGWNIERVRKGNQSILCAKRKPGSNCTGGRVPNNRGKCVCPSNKPVWNGKACVAKRQVGIQCRGGTVVQGKCVCPPGRVAQRLRRGVYRCDVPLQ